MSCKQVRHLLSYRREWTREEAARAEAHLAACASCQAIARQYELMDRRFGRLPVPVTTAVAPPIVSAASVRRAPAPRHTTTAPRPASHGVLVLIALAMVVVAAAVLSVSPPRLALPGEPTQPGPVHYTVVSGDNVWSIAQHFGLQPETIVWANPAIESAPDLLVIGQELIIPPVDGVWHTVVEGDTVSSLAEQFETTVEEIIAFEGNDLEEPYLLRVGQSIMIPDGRKEVVVTGRRYSATMVGTFPPNATQGSGRFSWPAAGMLVQPFWSGHGGIDIAGRKGVPIRAADAGVVSLAGRDTWGYGLQIVVDHGNGYVTRYAHLDTIVVRAGDPVAKGQQIGTMGASGRVTNSHLHFEILHHGEPENPLNYLP